MGSKVQFEFNSENEYAFKFLTASDFLSPTLSSYSSGKTYIPNYCFLIYHLYIL